MFDQTVSKGCDDHVVWNELIEKEARNELLHRLRVDKGYDSPDSVLEQWRRNPMNRVHHTP